VFWKNWCQSTSCHNCNISCQNWGPSHCFTCQSFDINVWQKFQQNSRQSFWNINFQKQSPENLSFKYGKFVFKYDLVAWQFVDKVATCSKVVMELASTSTPGFYWLCIKTDGICNCDVLLSLNLSAIYSTAGAFFIFWQDNAKTKHAKHGVCVSKSPINFNMPITKQLRTTWHTPTMHLQYTKIPDIDHLKQCLEEERDCFDKDITDQTLAYLPWCSCTCNSTHFKHKNYNRTESHC